MAIIGKVSYKPLKSGKIAVLMEVEATKANLTALTEMYGETASLLSETEFNDWPQDRFSLLLDIRTKCQQVQDLITAELEPLPISAPTTMSKGDILTAPDEFSATHPVGAEIRGAQDAD